MALTTTQRFAISAATAADPRGLLALLSAHTVKLEALCVEIQDEILLPSNKLHQDMAARIAALLDQESVKELRRAG